MHLVSCYAEDKRRHILQTLYSRRNFNMSPSCTCHCCCRAISGNVPFLLYSSFLLVNVSLTLRGFSANLFGAEAFLLSFSRLIGQRFLDLSRWTVCICSRMWTRWFYNIVGGNFLRKPEAENNNNAFFKNDSRTIPSKASASATQQNEMLASAAKAICHHIY